jgi:hypothetical protein
MQSINRLSPGVTVLQYFLMSSPHAALIFPTPVAIRVSNWVCALAAPQNATKAIVIANAVVIVRCNLTSPAIIVSQNQ